MDFTPLISVVVASYNYEGYITLTLDSILTQTYPHLEVIVVDDGSKDHSRDVVRRYEAQDSRVTLYTHPGEQNRGLAETIRLGMSKCRGQYIAFCESDDIWSHNHLEEVVKALALHPEAKIVSNDLRTFGAPEVKWMKKYFKRQRGKLHDGLNVLNVRRRLKMNWVPTFSCVMIEADMLRSLDFEPPVAKWLDIWLYQQILCRYPLLYIKQPLTLWRIHGDSLNSNTKAPEVKAFYSGLHNLLTVINGKIFNDIYYRTHGRWLYWLHRCTGSIYVDCKKEKIEVQK